MIRGLSYPPNKGATGAFAPYDPFGQDFLEEMNE